MKTRSLVLIFSICVLPAPARADVMPHALCSEGMVLQQKARVKIWGTADKVEKVTVTFRDEKATATADGDGRWVVVLNSGAAGGPFEMTIAGNNTISYKNVLVGEVWICSGQSNMEQSVNSSDKGDKEIASSAPHNPMLRMFTVTRNPRSTPQSVMSGPTPKAPNHGKWIDADPKTVGGFSAVGYFFGRHLHEKRKVPVGLIHTSWGGTRIEAWMSETTLTPYEKPTADPTDPQNVAAALYNGMIHPLLNYQVKGAIWYQGESNTGKAYKYRSLQPAMIENWRADFKNPDLAFYFVQLAPYKQVRDKPEGSDWAELREAQTMTLKLKNTGMAVITDYGCEYDIHPTPKRPIGERLALAARAQTYGEKLVYSGPMYKSVKFQNGKSILSFDHVGGGLVTRTLVPTHERKTKSGKSLGFAWRLQDEPKEQPGKVLPRPVLMGFAICGKDRVFHKADAWIEGETVVVNASKVVDEPIAVRYGWANHPICNLYNREGLPASPFRTDTFPGITQPKNQ